MLGRLEQQQKNSYKVYIYDTMSDTGPVLLSRWVKKLCHNKNTKYTYFLSKFDGESESEVKSANL